MNMSSNFDEFVEHFNNLDKEKSIKWVIKALETKTITIRQIYLEILAPLLNSIYCSSTDFECIWKEHIKTSIVRTIIEICFPYVLQERDASDYGAIEKTVLVLCPTEEYHEIGARMVADFFALVGYQVTFVGGNTPLKSFLSAIERMDPDYVAISTSNPYHIFQTQKTIGQIRQYCGSKLKIIVGGQAFKSNPNAIKSVGADMGIQTLEEIQKLREADS